MKLHWKKRREKKKPRLQAEPVGVLGKPNRADSEGLVPWPLILSALLLVGFI